MTIGRSSVVLVIAAAAVVVGVAAMPSEPQAKAKPQDPFVGSYKGVFDPAGLISPDGKKTPRPDCGSCHATAKIEAEKGKYVLKLHIDRGQRKYDMVFPGKKTGDKVVFKNAKYTFTAAKGKITGEREHKMYAHIRLKKAPAATTQPKPKD